MQTWTHHRVVTYRISGCFGSRNRHPPPGDPTEADQTPACVQVAYYSPHCVLGNLGNSRQSVGKMAGEIAAGVGDLSDQKWAILLCVASLLPLNSKYLSLDRAIEADS